MDLWCKILAQSGVYTPKLWRLENANFNFQIRFWARLFLFVKAEIRRAEKPVTASFNNLTRLTKLLDTVLVPLQQFVHPFLQKLRQQSAERIVGKSQTLLGNDFTTVMWGQALSHKINGLECMMQHFWRIYDLTQTVQLILNVAGEVWRPIVDHQ